MKKTMIKLLIGAMIPLSIIGAFHQPQVVEGYEVNGIKFSAYEQMELDSIEVIKTNNIKKSYLKYYKDFYGNEDESNYKATQDNPCGLHCNKKGNKKEVIFVNTSSSEPEELNFFHELGHTIDYDELTNNWFISDSKEYKDFMEKYNNMIFNKYTRDGAYINLIDYYRQPLESFAEVYGLYRIGELKHISKEADKDFSKLLKQKISEMGIK